MSGAILDCDPTTNAVDTGAGVTYTWGTNGHPVEMHVDPYGTSTGNTTDWEHWDPVSNQILFENAASSAGDLAVGLLGVSNATNGIDVEDRDPFGEVAASHTGLQFTAWSGAPAARTIDFRDRTFYGGGAGSNYQGADPSLAYRILAASRPDGYVHEQYGLAFQGTRTADLNSGMWTTMDSYGGSISDAMSQQPYMWNDNNGLLYQDPSGYAATAPGCITVYQVLTDTGDYTTLQCSGDGGSGALFGDGYGYGLGTGGYAWGVGMNQIGLGAGMGFLSYQVHCSRRCEVPIPHACTNAHTAAIEAQHAFYKAANDADQRMEQMKNMYSDIEITGEVPWWVRGMHGLGAIESIMEQAEVLKANKEYKAAEKLEYNACPQVTVG